ncbi:MAG: DNA mismatch repair protein MutS [Ruminococcaceae bacterium]|nr:DNA mismatch repair protein MutS [Oscillospiraceae bacterium]
MKKGELTPMMRQYLEIKEEYNDCILFFRLGDFYEMFFDDAITASRVLEITLTGKDCGMPERAPMCGVPFHSAQGYITKLIKNGYKVAICEQVEDPKDAKGIVKRDVIRVVTPGTVGAQTESVTSDNNFLACIWVDESTYGIAFADVTTGETFGAEGSNEYLESSVINLIATFKPSEVLVNRDGINYCKNLLDSKRLHNFYDGIIESDYYDEERAVENITKQFAPKTLDQLGLRDKRACVKALGGLLAYLFETQKVSLTHLNSFSFCSQSQHLIIDASSFRNLELTETMRDKEKRGSLLGILDRTKTAMGARRLKAWLDRPLVSPERIALRSNAVEELFDNTPMREEITDALKNVYDIERILSKVVYGSCNARDFVSLRQSLDNIVPVKNALKSAKSDFLGMIYQGIDTCDSLRNLLRLALTDDPPVTVKEGGMIKEGFDKELDRTKDMLKNGTSYIARIESVEKERTGIKNLKVAYNRVFGYYIEVSKSNLDKVPETYIRKQTLVGAERFITQELKDLESRILNAREKVNALEYENFLAIKEEILKKLLTLQQDAKLVSVADALCSLARVANQRGYVKPIVDESDIIDIKDGRHPVVEASLSDALFVPNDTYLNCDDSRFSIITGPNMAGKSTYMRQTALIVIMAQIGSFVPASHCHIGIVDAVFTRVGASDDLASGQSTFMVEMNEVAHILSNATGKSLVILDEIGRGTSTYDGLSIAWAVAEYISDKEKIGAKTLFATHYHELTELENSKDGVKNYSVAVKKRGDDITFLRKIVKGGTDDSFGIQVALLAGLPQEVIERAKQVLASVESGEKKEISVSSEVQVPKMQSDSSPALCEAMERLRLLDVSTLTPIEALNELYNLQKKVSEN